MSQSSSPSSIPSDAPRPSTIRICRACKTAFSKPRLFPKCGHPACSDCIINYCLGEGDQAECPTCHAFSTVTDINALHPYPYVEDAALYFLGKVDGYFDFLFETCPHPKTVFCSHCNVSFCDLCLLCHVEGLRLELGWFENRLEKRVLDLVGKLGQLKIVIEKQVKKSLDRLTSHFQHILLMNDDDAALKAQLSRICDLGDEQIGHVQNYINWFRNAEHLRENLTAMCAISVTETSLSKIANLSESVKECDVKLFEVEMMLKNSKFSEIGTTTSVRLSVSRQDNFTEDLVQACYDSIKAIAPLQLMMAFDYKYPSEIWKLHLAAKNGDLTTIKQLLEGVSRQYLAYAVEHRDSTDRNKTIFLQASECGHLEVVRYLVSNNKNCSASIFARSQHSFDHNFDFQKVGSLAVHLASSNGHFDVLQFLLTLNPEDCNALDGSDTSLLSRACDAGQLEVVKFLVAKKKVEIVNKTMSTWEPVRFAAAKGHLEIVKFLVTKGSTVCSVKSGDLGDSFLIAVRQGHVDVARFLYQLNNNFVNLVEEPSGNTALHIAAYMNRPEMVDFLLKETKIDVLKDNNDGQSAFDLAESRQFEDVVRVFEQDDDDDDDDF